MRQSASRVLTCTNVTVWAMPVLVLYLWHWCRLSVFMRTDMSAACHAHVVRQVSAPGLQEDLLIEADH
jgi:hypothetical protein